MFAQERERAVSVGYEDPINPTYDATTEMYHMVMEEVMRQINLRDRGKIAVMIASHNEDTIRKAVDLWVLLWLLYDFTQCDDLL